MLAPYDGYLTCRVNLNHGDFAQCDIVDAQTVTPEISVEEEYWVDLDALQIYPDTLGLSEDEFRARYPTGKEFVAEFRFRILEDGKAPAPQIGQEHRTEEHPDKGRKV